MLVIPPVSPSLTAREPTSLTLKYWRLGLLNPTQDWTFRGRIHFDPELLHCPDPCNKFLHLVIPDQQPKHTCSRIEIISPPPAVTTQPIGSPSLTSWAPPWGNPTTPGQGKPARTSLYCLQHRLTTPKHHIYLNLPTARKTVVYIYICADTCTGKLLFGSLNKIPWYKKKDEKGWFLSHLGGVPG